jgi:hypothetical protein
MYLKRNMLQICNKRHFSVCISDKLIYLWRLLSSRSNTIYFSRSVLTFQGFLQPPQAPPAVCLSTLMMEAVVSSKTSTSSDCIASCFKDSSLHTGCCEKIKYLLIHPCFHESLINPNVHDRLTESWLVCSEMITGSLTQEDSLCS